MKLHSNFKHNSTSATGILITNLGTPDAATPQALRKYLKEFLWDRRVVDIPRPIWWLILNGFILTTRPKKSAAAYQKVWTEEGSPLLQNAQHQKSALQLQLNKICKAPVKVALGMRYGNPSISSALKELLEFNCRRVLILPLYPQHATATTASTFDAVALALKNAQWIPDLRFVSSYHDNPHYIDALVKEVKNYWEREGKPKKLFFSFHGMPKKTLTAGDPYFCHCHKTARLIAEGLELHENEWLVAFQSRFGKNEWLKPYADQTLIQLGKSRLESVDVLCPGFSADCLETLEEMAEENKENFQHAGGGKYRYIPALNSTENHINALANIIKEHTAGWPIWDESWNQIQSDADSSKTLFLAQRLGARE